MAKKIEDKVTKETPVVLEVLEEVLEPEIKEETINGEVVLKDEKLHKGTHIVYLSLGKFVEFKNGKTVVDKETKQKLEEIGAI